AEDGIRDDLVTGVQTCALPISIDGRTTPPDGAAVIEADVEVTGTAVGPSRIVHVGPVESTQPTEGFNGPPAADGHGVHVVGPGEIGRASCRGREGRTAGTLSRR